jgi:hypothetical protein
MASAGLPRAHRRRSRVSRYLSHLARETHSRLRPSKGFRLQLRAPVTFEDIYEERIVSPEPARRDAPAPLTSAIEPAPPPRTLAPPPGPASISAPASTPSLPPVQPVSSTPIAPLRPEPGKSNARLIRQLETAAGQRFSHPDPHVPAFDSAPARPPRPPRVLDATDESLTAVSQNSSFTPSFQIEPIRASSVGANAPAISDPIHASSNAPESRPEASHSLRRVYSAQPQRQIAVVPPPAIDVTIGNIEVTIEGPPTSRRTEPHSPKSQPMPPISGMLARMYLDR